MKSLNCISIAAIAALALAAWTPAGAEEQQGKGKERSLEEIAQQTNNPVSDLWMHFVQNDFTIYKFDPTGGGRILNSLKYQPVAPILLTKNVRLINRPVFQFNSFETPTSSGDFERKTGLGDLV